MKIKNFIAFSLLGLLALTNVKAQEEPLLPYKVAPQNLLKFNRFLINPTFSTVQEDKSYINFFHRNQSVQFNNNDQTYFVSYSGRIGDRTGLGLSIYSQKKGLVSNIGALANYAYGVKLNDKSNFTFGANLAYYNTGYNHNSASPIDPLDPLLSSTDDTNILSFQPGFNISFGRMDFGAYAENLFDYNLKTSKQLTDFADKTYSAHLQYTYPFENSTGIMEDARFMPLVRVRMNAQDGPTFENQSDLTYGGSLILDLPKLGWVQGGYDTYYGASAGAGFNLNKRLSLGYNMEKGFGTDFNNLGITHEISFAYSFTPNLTEDRVFLENNDNDLVDLNETSLKDPVASNEELEELQRKLAENDAIIAELMFRQDSLELNRKQDLEKRFEMVMRMVRNETKGKRPDLERKAQKLFLGANSDAAITSNNSSNDGRDGLSKNKYTEQSKEEIPVTDKRQAIVSGTTRERDAIAAANITKSKPVQNGNGAIDKPIFDNTKPTQKVKESLASSNTKSHLHTITAQDNTQRSKIVRQKAGPQKAKSRKFRDLQGVENGYYVVANVYKGGQYMHKFINSLEQKGIAADYIDNPNNGLKYVYLERYNTWQEAVDAHKSNIDGKYRGLTWIMNVDNLYTNEAYAENTNKVKERSSKYNDDILQRNVKVKDKIAAKEQKAKTHKINGVDSGYYLIANVFANPKNANSFVKLLNSYGLNASYFINPENNYRYVYLKRHQSWNNALLSYYTKINDAYNDKMWIMRVTPGQMA